MLRTKLYEQKLEHLRESRRTVVAAEIDLKKLVGEIMTQRTDFRVGQVIASKQTPQRPFAIIERITCPNWQDLQETDQAQLIVRKIKNDGQPSMLTQRLRDPSKYMLYKGELDFDPKNLPSKPTQTNDEDEL